MKTGTNSSKGQGNARTTEEEQQRDEGQKKREEKSKEGEQRTGKRCRCAGRWRYYSKKNIQSLLRNCLLNLSRAHQAGSFKTTMTEG